MTAIRRAELGDLAALLALEASFPGDRLSRRSWRHLLAHGNADTWVAANGTDMLGNAIVLYRRKTSGARLYSLIVAPPARGRGIACALVQAAEAAAAARCASRIHLEVRADNDAAISLYLKLGYRFVTRLPSFYEDGQDALRFDRFLPPAQSATGPRARAA